jgi:hypothetical protein
MPGIVIIAAARFGALPRAVSAAAGFSASPAILTSPAERLKPKRIELTRFWLKM